MAINCLLLTLYFRILTSRPSYQVCLSKGCVLCLGEQNYLTVIK